MFDSFRTGLRPRDPTKAHARRTDPPTSHEAAKTVNRVPGKLRQSQRDVLDLFYRFGPMHDELLIQRAEEAGVTQSDSGLRTRRRELVDLKFLEDSGQKTTTKGGGETTIWRRR